jgi:integrase
VCAGSNPAGGALWGLGFRFPRSSFGVSWESLWESLERPRPLRHMRGHLEQRGEDSWRLKVYVGMDGGRRRYLAKTVRGTKRAAENQLNKMLVEAANSQHPASDPTFADLAAQWREIGSTSLSRTTRAEYERLLEKRLLPRFGSTKLRAIRPVDIDHYYADLHRGARGSKPLGAQSIQHVHALLRMLLNQAVRWEWIPSNPVSKASPPRVPKWGVGDSRALGGSADP